jgi:putative pyrroloquinoline-quinone binding quinoprotein
MVGMSDPRRRRPARPVPFRTAVLGLLMIVVGVAGWRAVAGSGGDEADAAGGPGASAAGAPGSSAQAPDERPPAQHADGAGVPTPGPVNTKLPGLTTFRGNATRSYYGEGPVPKRPVVLWRYPQNGGLCSQSINLGKTSTWCGTGWTGQPNVIPTKNGLEVRVGAYDGRYHFLNGMTGRPVRPDLVTDDLAKGSATSDPDGYPLFYAGSRDNYLRVVALDRPEPTVLWKLNADTSVPDPVWNNDWDGVPLVIGDYLLEGGENSWFYVVRLHRHYDADGLVTVDPRIVLRVPGFDDALMRRLPDQDVSIESSVSFFDGVAYFANSGGLVQGWDISDVLAGGTKATRVFRFWTGDDTDASVVIDEHGDLYVGSEMQRFNATSRANGQLMKLDPSRPSDPLVWSIPIDHRGPGGLAGVWATPAVYGDMVYESTNSGELLGVDRGSGKVRWRISLPGPLWSSPVPVDDVLLQADCAGTLHAFDISKPERTPREVWNVDLDSGCIESTPALWDGRIYVGTRSGGIYGIGDRKA